MWGLLCRTILVKLDGFKIKERILAEAKKMKPKSIQISEDFSKATAEIRKKNWERAKSPKQVCYFSV